MNQPYPVILVDPETGLHVSHFDQKSPTEFLQVPPPDQYRWLIEFIQTCRSSEWCDRVLHGLKEAIRLGHSWERTINAFSLEYEAKSQSVSASYIYGSPFPPSTMPVASFLAIFEQWTAEINRRGVA